MDGTSIMSIIEPICNPVDFYRKQIGIFANDPSGPCGYFMSKENLHPMITCVKLKKIKKSNVALLKNEHTFN